MSDRVIMGSSGFAFAFAIVAMVFASESVGILVHENHVALAMVALGLAAVCRERGELPHSGPNSAQSWRWRFAFVLALAASSAPVDVRSFACSLAFASIGAVSVRPATKLTWRGLGAGAFVFGAGEYVVRHDLLAWYATRSIAERVSAWTTALTQYPLALTPTYAGTTLLGLALALVGGVACSTRQGSWKRLAVAVPAILALYAAWLRFFAMLPFAAPAPGAQPTGNVDAAAAGITRALYPHGMTVVLAVLMIAAVVWFCISANADERATEHTSERSSPRWPAFVPALSMVGVIGSTFVAPTRVDAVERGPIAVYSKGFVNFVEPQSGVHGPGSWGMAGSLPHALRALGFDVEYVDDLEPETLERHRVVVMFNQDEDFPAERRQGLHSFVERGGALVVLGDHTQLRDGKHLIDQPLERTQLRFEFDNAEFTIGGWIASIAYWPHPIFERVGDRANEPGIVIGCSIGVSYPAVPWVVGRFGHSDPGDVEAVDNAYMGNRTIDPGERLGDCVLVAAQDVGRGKIVVFGDTSPLTNGLLPHTWVYVGRLFTWLMSSDTAALPLWRDVLGLLLFCAAMLSISWIGVRRASTLAWSAIAVLAVAGAAKWVRAATTVDGIVREVPARTDATGKTIAARSVALIDQGHCGAYSTEGVKESGIGGLVLQLTRESWNVFEVDALNADQLRASALLVTVAPLRPHTPQEVDAIAAFVESGGSLLLAVGFEERVGSLPLLERFGLDVLNHPLGRAAGTFVGTESQPKFWKAWEVTGGVPLVSAWSRPIVIEKTVGKGRVCLLGDAEFFRSANLETKDHTVDENLELIDRLAAGMRAR